MAADPKGEHPADEEPVGPVLEAVKAQHAAMDDPVAQQAREHDRAKAREGVIDRLHEDTQRLASARHPNCFGRCWQICGGYAMTC